jgi:hypothetical protein
MVASEIAKPEADRPSSPEEAVMLAEYRDIERHMTWFGDGGRRFQATGEPAGQPGSQHVRLMPSQMAAGDDGMGDPSETSGSSAANGDPRLAPTPLAEPLAAPVAIAAEPADPDAGAAAKPARVGVLVVHGIGEQRRFEHLEQQTKKIAKALLEREARSGRKTKVTFEIVPSSGGAPYQSDQDSWMSGRFPAVRALVRHGDNLEHETQLYFHEVWWADANERPTLAKQLRFWGWGLAMWSIPGRENSGVAGFKSMRLPHFPDRQRGRLSWFNRGQLFGTAWIFVLSSLSITLAIFVLKRLNFGLWSPVETFVNYVSGVKLYTQSHRSGGGPLDGIREPPRFTIRRRMVRALVDVATADYDRWYVLAHSLGTVVAFNGLMSHGHSIPNYLDEKRWRRLCRHRGWCGPPRDGKYETIEAQQEKPEIPPRPLWIGDDDIVVYREKLFEKLRGFLTYGSPLDKFAGMWPAYAAINRNEGVFSPHAQWINIFDRTDPVAAALKAYDSEGSIGLSPQNYGYKASPWLLLGHLKYLDLSEEQGRRGQDPADRVVDWLLLEQFEPPAQPKRVDEGWYEVGGWTSGWRVVTAYLQWLVVLVVLTYLGVWALRWMLHLFGQSFAFTDPPLSWILGFLNVAPACANDCTGAFDTLRAVFPSWHDAVGLAICGAGFTAVMGLLGKFFREDDNDPLNW